MSADTPDFDAFTAEGSPMSMQDAMSDPFLRDLATPEVEVGDMAADFTLPEYDFEDGNESPTGHDFNLLSVARNQPVALVFGSYT